MVDKVSTIQPLAGFDWRRVKWIDANATPSECCYCGREIPAEAVPLVIYNWDPALVLLAGTGMSHELGSQQAAFCDPCADKWFGLKFYAEADAPDMRRKIRKEDDDGSA